DASRAGVQPTGCAARSLTFVAEAEEYRKTLPANTIARSVDVAWAVEKLVILRAPDGVAVAPVQHAVAHGERARSGVPSPAPSSPACLEGATHPLLEEEWISDSVSIAALTSRRARPQRSPRYARARWRATLGGMRALVAGPSAPSRGPAGQR